MVLLVKLGLVSRVSRGSRGISLIELVIVMSFFAILTSIITVNVFTTGGKSNVSDAANLLVTDLRSQQIKAMVSEVPTGSTPDSHGVYFERTRYVLFRGSTYAFSNPSNFTVSQDENTEVSSITFSGSQVVFAKGSGEITNFTDGADTIRLRNTVSGQEKTIRLNRHGVVASIN